MRVSPSPYQKPSPRGEGAPKGRIGYWRYESERGKRIKQAENENTAFPVSSFRAKREIFLAQRSSDERQMRSRRSTHAILSLPHKYRVPLRRKRSLGYARDDETRERAISHSLSFHHVEGYPFGADLSSAFGAPLLQGATQQSCKNADPSQGLLPHIVISSEARNLCHS